MSRDTGSRIRTVVADSMPIVAGGIEACLRPEGFDIVGTAADTHSLISLAELARPQLIVLELTAENRAERLGALARIVGRDGCRALAFTADLSPGGIQSALEAGCLGVVPRTAAIASLVEAARAVANGQEYIHQQALTAILHGMQRVGAPGTRLTLSTRELSVLSLVAAGCTNPVIAEQLGIATTTVKTHVERLLRKLSANDRAHAVRNAMRLGVIE